MYLKRLIAIDKALSTEGLNVRAAAKRFKVHVRTIRHDIKRLRAIGPKTEVWYMDNGTYRQFYVSTARPVFSCNL